MPPITDEPFQIRTGFDASWLPDFVALYEQAGLGRKQTESLERALINSYCVATAWSDASLIGAGRLISDGAYYACVFDVAVMPAYQQSGVGRRIMATLEQAVPGLRLHLTATFGKEGFYRRCLAVLRL